MAEPVRVIAHFDGNKGRVTTTAGGIPPASVPLSFLAASAIGLVACGVALILAHSYAVVDPTEERVVGAAHFAMLATLSMGVLGALHQFIPVITKRPLRSVRLSRATFVFWLLGAWLLPLGFITRTEPVVEAGGAFAGLAVILLVVNVSAALLERGKGTPVVGLRFAIAGFAVTACYGVVYVMDRQAQWFDLSGRIVLAHAVVGIFGWLGLTYISVAEKLWPMFLLSHVPGRHRAGQIAVLAVPAGVLLLSPGLLFGLAWLAWCGAVGLAIGLAAHLFSLAMHIVYRRRSADLHLLYVVTAAVWLVAGVVLALAAVLAPGSSPHAEPALIAGAVTAFSGWLLISLLGHAYKVVPFIVWSTLRGRGIRKNARGAPLMFADLYSHRWAAASYVLATSGTALVCLGFAFSLATAIAIGGGFFIATGISAGVNLSFTPMKLLRRWRREQPAH